MQNFRRRRFGLRQFAYALAGVLVVVLLILWIFNNSKTTPQTSNSGVQITSNAQGEYQSVIKDGKYVVSAARGLTATSFSNGFNVSTFENGLLDISKNIFKPSSYIFEEGQFLTTDTLSKWLNRVSDSNPDGLNPKDNGLTDNNRAPIYIQSIEEQDFMTKDGNNLLLSGITVGIAVNQVDEYTKVQYGPTFTQNISADVAKQQGEQAAQKILERMRGIDGVSKNTKIVFAIYSAQPSDSIVGGNFIEYAVSSDGTKLDSWQGLNIQDIAFPKLSTDTSTLGSSDNTKFSNFKNEAENFFPNLSGVTAQARYQDGNITQMNVTVTTQYYSATELRNFTTFLSQIAPKYLPEGIPIRIDVQASNKTQAVLNRSSGTGSFETILFSSL